MSSREDRDVLLPCARWGRPLGAPVQNPDEDIEKAAKNCEVRQRCRRQVRKSTRVSVSDRGP